jgi:transcriptional regulator with XRE-family HTH domain
VKPDQKLQVFLKELRYILISLRMERQLNFSEASANAGLSRNGLEKIETGAALPSLESLFLLCESYNISLADLMQTSLKKLPKSSKEESLRSKKTVNAKILKKRSEEELKILVQKLKLQKQWQLAEGIGKLNAKKQNALKALIDLK